MNPEWTGLALAATTPAICLLVDVARRRRQPLLAGVALVLLLAAMVATCCLHNSLALGLVLPLAALSVCGLLYLPCVQIWPRATVGLCAGATLFSAVVLLVLGRG